MHREELMMACTNDIAGKTRGKAFPASQLDKRVHRGVGWTPTNVQITCFDSISDSPFGSLGDLVLIPDASTRVAIETGEAGAPPESFVLGNIRYTDGRPWEFCTRSILEAALERLKRVAGVTLLGAFEHEFQFGGAAMPAGNAYTLAGFRVRRGFGEALVAAMRAAGIAPDTFMKEYGADQYEVTMGPKAGVRFADEAVIVKELVRSLALAHGEEVTFTPIRDPAGVGNGVHVHMSFLDADGRPATWDPAGKHELSPVAGQFVAGILKYLDAIIALTAPSVVSYLRLTPHRWSAAFNNLGFRDREASVRICPVSDLSDIARASQFNFEFRAADAAASPYLALAAIVHAGVQGIEEGLDVPEATQEDLSLLDPAALAARGYLRLPTTLDAALERFAGNAIATRWFPQGFADVYVKHKQGEIAYLAGREMKDICVAYQEVY